jgi:subtilisin family serine protease
VADEVIVRYRSGVGSAERRRERRSQGTRLERSLPRPATELIEIEDGESVRATVADLRRRPEVLYAQPNYVRRASAVPSDPRFGELWGLHNTGQPGSVADADIDAPEAWNRTRGSRNVTVAVVDTGVTREHPDLTPNLWSNPGESGDDRETNGVDDDLNGKIDDDRGWDFRYDDNDPGDRHGHGTHVAGTIGARGNDGVGVTGVNWNVSIMPVKVLSDDIGTGTDADIAEGFAYADRMNADVVNVSLGGEGSSPVLDDAIRRAPDTLFVAAAGNFSSYIDGSADHTDSFYPCGSTADNLVCVAASDSQDGLAAFSNRGATSVDLAAPGVSTVSTLISRGETILFEDFETDLVDRWLTSGDGSPWQRAPGPPERGFVLESTPQEDSYRTTDSNVHTVAPLDLSRKKECNLFYELAADLGDGGTLYVEASTDGENWRFVNGYPWTGGSWRSSSSNFSEFDGEPRVRLRFRLNGWPAKTAGTVKIDDLAVHCYLPELYDDDSYGAMSGTSMATPHVAGVVALMRSAKPEATVEQLKRVLLKGVDLKSSLAGRTVTGGRLNAARSLALTEFDPPTVAAPGHSLVEGPALDSTTVPVRLGLSGTDEATPSRDLLYDVEVSRDGAGWSRIATEVGAGAKRSLRPGATYRFRARAVDKAGNRSPWRAGRAFEVRTFPESRSYVTYRGYWGWMWNGRGLGWTAFTGMVGARASFSFFGTDAAVVMPERVRYGRVRICVDPRTPAERCRVVDLGARSLNPRRALWVSSGLSRARRHTLEVTAREAPVYLDGFAVLR